MAFLFLIVSAKEWDSLSDSDNAEPLHMIDMKWWEKFQPSTYFLNKKGKSFDEFNAKIIRKIKS